MDEAKFWIMPRTGTSQEPVDSTAPGVTATKGFDLAGDLINGLPELDDQIGGAMVGAERVTTAVRELQPFVVQFQDNPDPHAASPARVRAGTIFSGRIINNLPMNAAPWRVEIEYATGDPVIFDVLFGNRKTIPAERSVELEFLPTGDVTY